MAAAPCGFFGSYPKRNNMKKILSILLCAALAGGCVLTGCGSGESKTDGSAATGDEASKDGGKSSAEAVSDPLEGVKATASTDKYRNVYQIFTQSFCDSNGDEIGDFQGIISKLDYLNDGDPNKGDDLGVDALWMTPITPSESYHKYSVENYYDVDADFGTLEDFDKLVEECHKRGINVIFDLVLNHISNKNPLFVEACEEVKKGKLDGKAEYFEFHEPDYYSADVNTIQVGDYVCEANFSPTMPEWNLTSEKTKEEFTRIAKFWLDRGVDGFRLDAVKYFDNKHTNGVEFQKWFVDTCRGIKKDVYLVGEDWTNDLDIADMYESGIDSLFAFRFSQSSGDIIDTLSTANGASFAKKVASYDKKMSAANADYINAVFLSNHDQIRIANALESRGLEAEKFAANLYMLMPGNSFTYYGEEIGMKAPYTDSDKWYRLPMAFDSDSPKIRVDGAVAPEAPKYGGVKQQLEDKNSLLNHYRRLITAKLQNPLIARGRATGAQSFDDKEVGAYYIEKDGEKLLVIHNFNATAEKTLSITSDMIADAQVYADFLGSSEDNHLAIRDGKLTMPPYSSVIIGSKR